MDEHQNEVCRLVLPYQVFFRITRIVSADIVLATLFLRAIRFEWMRRFSAATATESNDSRSSVKILSKGTRLPATRRLPKTQTIKPPGRNVFKMVRNESFKSRKKAVILSARSAGSSDNRANKRPSAPDRPVRASGTPGLMRRLPPKLRKSISWVVRKYPTWAAGS